MNETFEVLSRGRTYSEMKADGLDNCRAFINDGIGISSSDETDPDLLMWRLDSVNGDFDTNRITGLKVEGVLVFSLRKGKEPLPTTADPALGDPGEIQHESS